MSGPGFRKDLYQGTAEPYDRFRPGYPPALVDDLWSRAGLRSSARVLDLACGTGQVAFALAGHAREVVAVDQEAGAVAYGQRNARRLGVPSIRWLVGSAEDVVLDGPFDLVPDAVFEQELTFAYELARAPW